MDEHRAPAYLPRLPVWSFALRVVVAIALVALALLLWRSIDVVLLVIGGIVIAVLLRAAADPIVAHTPVPERWAVPLATIGIILILAIVVWLVGAEVREQVSQLFEQLPQAWQTLQRTLGGEEFSAWVAQRGGDLASSAAGVLSSLLTYATTLGGALVNLILVLIGGVYLAMQPQLYRDGLIGLLPGEAARAQAREALDATGRALRLWLLGQLVSMTLVGILTGLGLWLVGVPAPLALGLLAFLLEFVPVVGPILAAIPGILLALAQGWGTALWAVLVYLVVQQLESNLITPLVQRKAVELPPALTLFAVLAIGAVFGPLGLVLAAPTLVIAFVLVKMLWVREALDEPTTVPGES